MKIAIVCPYDYFSPGGVQTHVRDSACELGRLGHSVTVIAPGVGKCPENINNVVFLGKGKKINFNQTTFDITFINAENINRLRTILDREKFDIIHFHTIWTPFMSMQILYYSNSINICTFHDTPPDNLAGKITKIIFHFISHLIFRHLDAVIAVSDTPSKHLAKIPDKHIQILPPCIDLSRFSPRNQPLYPAKGEQATILFLGRLDKRKGLFVLLEAYKLLLKDNFNVRLLIGGSGTEQQKLNNYLMSENLDNVVCLGYVNDDELSGCYASCDIFCAPALYGESFGIVLVEAMASGKAVVAASNPGYKIILDEKKEFCLARPGDVHDLYLKLKSLLIDIHLRQELANWGLRESVKYDCQTVIPNLVKIYQNASNLKA